MTEPEAAEPEVTEPQGPDPDGTGPAEQEAYPPGWYADYADTSLLRYWDGTEWTEHTHPATADH